MSSSMCRVVKASDIANSYSDEVKRAINSLPTGAGAARPKLVGYLCGGADSPSATYAEWTRKACESVGIEYELRRVGAGAREGEEGDSSGLGGASDAAELETAILEANSDPSVNGIMVYYPTGAGGRQDSYIQQVVTREKDVEGLNFSYLFNLYHNIRQIDPRTLSLSLAHSAQLSAKQSAGVESSGSDGQLVKSILPCTPLALVKTMEYLGVYNSLLPYGQRAYGRVITVVNRSEVVGRPLAALLANDGARVFSVDVDGVQEFNKRKPASTSSSTAAPNTNGSSSSSASTAAAQLPHHVVHASKHSLDECLKQSDVVITGVPSASYKIPTASLRDGVIAVNFSSEKNFESDIKEKASIYVPTIGKTTIAMLQRNLLRLTEYQRILREQPDLVRSAGSTSEA